jgi:hypothetical protein
MIRRNVALRKRPDGVRLSGPDHNFSSDRRLAFEQSKNTVSINNLSNKYGTVCFLITHKQLTDPAHNETACLIEEPMSMFLQCIY